MDQVVRNSVFAALPNEQAGRAVIELAQVMEPIVLHSVLAVDVLTAGAIAGQQ